MANGRGESQERVGNLSAAIVFQKRGPRVAGPAGAAGSRGECLLSFHGPGNDSRLCA